MEAKAKLVLVVDDEEALRHLLVHVLSLEGYTVATAGDGQEALEKIESLRPDLMTLDLTMPAMDGWAVLDRLRGVEGAPLIVAVSASASVDARRARIAGAAATLTKPFPLSRLVEICRLVLNRSMP